jgi:hypothetical protein
MAVTRGFGVAAGNSAAEDRFLTGFLAIYKIYQILKVLTIGGYIWLHAQAETAAR